MRYALFLLVLLIWASCQQVSGDDQRIREEAKQKLVQPENKGRFNRDNDNTVKVTGPTTKIQFTETKYDFGVVEEGTKVKHVFEFKNVGTEPLVIQDAKASCGCTVPTYSNEPVPPGKTGKIEVVFDSKGRPGKTSKYVTVTANTEPVKTKIYLTGEVRKKK